MTATAPAPTAPAPRPPAPPHPRATRATLEGFGMACRSAGWVLRVEDEETLREAFSAARRAGLKVCLRGSGASYGDAALHAEQLVLDCRPMAGVLDWDPTSGVIRARAGTTIEDVWRHAIADGWWPPVVSGTMVPTLGGAVAMNIHGKNCWAAGPIGDHVLALRVVLPDGSARACSREDDPALFEAIIGGFGVLGVITEVTLQLKAIETGLVEVEAQTTPDLEAMFRCFEDHLDTHTYLVGWLDAFARGRSLGRGLVHLARHLPAAAVDEPAASLRARAQELPTRFFGLVPKGWMWLALKPFANQLGMRALNAVKYLAGWLRDRGRRYRQSLGAFNFLLDFVPNWKWVYRPGGFIQHQSFLPDATARDAIRAILETTHRHGLVPYLAVFKRHRPDAFLLSHGLDGWSLALDIPVDRRAPGRLLAMTGALDDIVVRAGGRFYPAKDGTVSAAAFRASLPDGALARFAALKAEVDPDGLLSSDLYRRLFEGGPTNPGLG